MKHCRLALYVGLSWLAWTGFPAWAQKAHVPPEEEGLYERGFVEGAPAGVPESFSHTVTQGDTLWKLAETYLGDSAQWPVLWATNENIANPHWIFPGEVVQLSPPPQGPLPSGGADASPALEPPEESALPRLVERPADLPSVVAIDTLVTPSPIEGWGLIESSMTQSEMLSPLDEVAIALKKDSTARPGETFLILRSLGKLRHPKTKKVLGHATAVVGAARLSALEGRRAMAHVVKANAEILRGDMLGPMGESNLRPVYMRRNDKAMEGWVVATHPRNSSMAGGQYLVFVDKGSADGVAPGNSFQIMRQQDGLSLQTVLQPTVVHKGAPRQAVGACTLIDVKSNVSTCLVTWASREIVPGDSVEMREE